MEIKKENVLAAYKTAREAGADSTMKVLESLFGKETFKPQDVTERIKTFEDACDELGEDHLFVRAWETFQINLDYADVDEYTDIADFAAYLKLRIITAALNEGWQPKFTEDEWRWFPWFYLYTEDELAKRDEEKQTYTVIATGDYETEFAGFAFAHSSHTPTNASACVGSRLCYKSKELSDYSGRQFVDLWADFNLIRKIS